MPTYPYISGTGAVVKAFEQLRKGFPVKVDAAYLQRFQIAPSNESYVIGILRFLGLIDDEGNKREDHVDFFFGNEEKFKTGLDTVLRNVYSDLLTEMGEDAFTTPRDDLGHWFRGADKTSELMGKRQAGTFLALAGLAGHDAPPAPTASSIPKPRATSSTKGASGIRKKKTNVDVTSPAGTSVTQQQSGVGLTVRIEVNLPVGGDADTYDAIFASIKRHLIP